MKESENSTSSKKTKTIYISNVISIALVLLMTGLLGLILIHAKNLSDYVKQNIVLNVIVNESAKDVEVTDLQKQLNANPHILKTQYIGKEEAAKSLTKDLGEDFVEFLGYNPLLSSIDVYMKADFANNETIERLTKTLSANPLVKEVVYQRSLINLVNQNIRMLSLIILAFAGILLIIAIALTNNTIRLAIYSQRFLIKSMQLVGATRGFIRRPFLGYGILHGFLAGLVAIILLVLTLYFAQQQVPELIVLHNWFEFGIVFAGVLGLGIFISLLSTYFAVSRFLRSKMYNLYR